MFLLAKVLRCWRRDSGGWLLIVCLDARFGMLWISLPVRALLGPADLSLQVLARIRLASEPHRPHKLISLLVKSLADLSIKPKKLLVAGWRP